MASVATASAGSVARAREIAPLHGAALAVAVAGVVAQVVRPLAPDLGPPASPGRWFDPEHVAAVTAYRTPLYAAAALALVIRVSVPLLIALAPRGRQLVDRTIDRVGPHRPARAAAVVVVGLVVLVDLVILPLRFWAGYVHEGQWGFRTAGIGGWTYDWLVAVLPGWMGAAVLALLGFTLARRLPRAWPPVAALGAAGLTAMVVFAAPLVLEPLQFRMTPLEPGAVRDAVTAVVERSEQRIDRILVADASRRTTKHNAYVSGLGATRRLVLYDTLIAERPAAEVASVVAHELGHDRNADLLRGTLFAGTGTIIAVYAIALLLRRRARVRGGEPADPRVAAVVVAAVVVLNVLSMPVQNLASRRAEAAADLASLDLTRDPQTYIAKHVQLSRANLSDPAPPTWVRVLWSTHPPPVQRLALGEWWAATGGRLP